MQMTRSERINERLKNLSLGESVQMSLYGKEAVRLLARGYDVDDLGVAIPMSGMHRYKVTKLLISDQ